MTNEETMFARYRGKRILLDANLLLLYLIGTFERERIERFKRTSDFTKRDFDLLLVLLAEFKVQVTTPHLLTEVNSLANALPYHLKAGWCEHFAFQVKTWLEIFEPAVNVMQESSFNPFGLADAAVQNASIDILVLTEDYRLSGFLQSQGVSALNFKDLTD